MNMKELDLVVLTEDILYANLKKGDVGTIVAVYDHGKGYEVEFMTFDGSTVGVLTLFPHQIRSVNASEIMSVRSI